MNWHFNFFLLNIAAWTVLAVLVCNSTFIKKPKKVNIKILTKLGIITLALLAGLFSAFINGFPDQGFYINSFIYAFIVSISLVVFLQIKSKKEVLPKISRRNKKVAYI